MMCTDNNNNNNHWAQIECSNCFTRSRWATNPETSDYIRLIAIDIITFVPEEFVPFPDYTELATMVYAGRKIQDLEKQQLLEIILKTPKICLPDAQYFPQIKERIALLD